MSQVVQSNDQYILFDAAYLAYDDCVKLFDTNLVGCENSANFDKRGRGVVRFLQHGPHCLVAKHYLRGGLLSHFIRDQYIACDAEATRAFKEWRLLAMMQDWQLPVPAPVAARVEMRHCCYRADLITVQIDGAKTLAQYLSESVLASDGWQAIGQCIKRFHRKGIYHADLNASNILIDQRREFFLLDFDKGCVKGGELWKVDNLERLKRSLAKYKKKKTNFCFAASDWVSLLRGYMAS